MAWEAGTCPLSLPQPCVCPRGGQQGLMRLSRDLPGVVVGEGLFSTRLPSDDAWVHELLLSLSWREQFLWGN